MPAITIRKLDDQIFRDLRVRAAQHGLSVEEEVRQILKRAVSAPDRLGDFALQTFGPAYGVNLELPEHSSHDPVDLSS